MSEIKLDFDDVSSVPQKDTYFLNYFYSSVSGMSRKIMWIFSILNIDYKYKFLKSSKSGKGFHVLIETEKDISDLEIVAIQAIIGSDYKRETFNLNRVRQGETKYWNLLFSSSADKTVYENKKCHDNCQHYGR